MFRQRGTNWQEEWGKTRKGGLGKYLATYGILQLVLFFVLLGIIDWVFDGHFPSKNQILTNAVSAVIYAIFISLLTWYSSEKKYKIWLERTNESQPAEDDH